METDEKTKSVPFDRAYVMNRTVEGMRSAVDFSIRKTMFRNKEFHENPEKQAEIMETLAGLTALHKLISDFVEHNETLFQKED